MLALHLQSGMNIKTEVALIRFPTDSRPWKMVTRLKTACLLTVKQFPHL